MNAHYSAIKSLTKIKNKLNYGDMIVCLTLSLILGFAYLSYYYTEQTRNIAEELFHLITKNFGFFLFSMEVFVYLLLFGHSTPPSASSS